MARASAQRRARQPRIAWQPKQMKLHSSDGPQGRWLRHLEGDATQHAFRRSTRKCATSGGSVVDAVVASKPARCRSGHAACDNCRLDMAAELECKCRRPKSEMKVTSALSRLRRSGSHHCIAGERQYWLRSSALAICRTGAAVRRHQEVAATTARRGSVTKPAALGAAGVGALAAAAVAKRAPEVRQQTTMRASRRHRRQTR